MPSEKILAEKQRYVAELKESLKSVCVNVIISYKDITVAENTKFRKDLREAGDTYRVVKNTLLSRALKGAGIKGLDQILEDTTAITYSNDNYISGAGILSALVDRSEIFEIKAGFVGDGAIDTATIKEPAELSSKEILVTKALSGLNAPIIGFVIVLNGIMEGLVVALNAIAER